MMEIISRAQEQGPSSRPLVEREYPRRDVVEHPVDSLDEVLPGHGGAALDAPVVGFDAIQVQSLDCEKNGRFISTFYIRLK